MLPKEVPTQLFATDRANIVCLLLQVGNLGIAFNPDRGCFERRSQCGIRQQLERQIDIARQHFNR